MRSDIIKISTKGMSRQEWLEERRNAIGGSDTSAILGLNPYATPYTVWADKTGRLPEKEDSEAMRQGRDFEQYVADRFTEVSGKKTRRVNAILKSPEYPFASANIDRDIVGEDSGLECKTTSVLNLRNFRDGDFPAQYYTQSVHYLAVTGYTRWYVAVLILNKGFLIYQLTRREGDTVPDWCESSVYVSDDEVAALMDAEREFWAFVESDTPPAVTGAETDGKALSAVFPGGGEEVVSLSEISSTIDLYKALKENIKVLETDLARCEQEIKAALGNNEHGQAGNWVVTWKTQKRRTFDAKAYAEDHKEEDLSPYYHESSFRKFEIKEAR